MIASSSQPNLSIPIIQPQAGLLNTIPETLEHHQQQEAAGRMASSMTQMKSISNLKSLKDIRSMIKNSGGNPASLKNKGNTPRKIGKGSEEATDFLLHKAKQEIERGPISQLQP